MKNINKKRKLIVLSGPSGVGKGTVLKMFLKKNSDFKLSISCTTRAKRQGEQDGVDYFYLTKDDFKESIKNNEFVEWAEFSGNYYGTKKEFVKKCLSENNDLILEIDTQGAFQVKDKMNEAILIFIAPPSLSDLEYRLRNRKTESEEAILKRLDSVKFEIENSKRFDYIIVNDKLEETLVELEKLYTLKGHMIIKGKTVLIGITGGIAAYKVCDLIRLFIKQGANVKVIATENALNFVTKLTLETLSQNQVFVKQFEYEEYKPEHISLADEADIFVIAPASANTISKLATGICDNLLTSVACAFKKPIILAPAMNCNMWENKIIQANITNLESVGYSICQPEEGFLACGYQGNGRLCSIEKIFDRANELLNSKKKLLNKKIVITSGGTKEKIDSVRFISNFSSGKMGAAIADEAYNQGAEVVLVTTCSMPQKQYKIEQVQSALDMQKAVEKEFQSADCLIMAAAVADYRAKNIQTCKIKKTSDDEISVSLVKNPDILQEISAKKKKNQLVVGFCAESENLLENAKNKIQKKGCDFLIANDISRSDIGFSSDYNEVFIIDKSGQVDKIDKAEKKEIAKKVLDKVFVTD